MFETAGTARTIFVAATIAFATACQSLFPNSEPTVSAGELLRESTADVRSRYEGKAITVRGYVTIEAAMPYDDEDEGLLMLGEKDGRGYPLILCWFSGKKAAEFSKIKGDQYITVKGVFSGELGAELSSCSLVEVE